MSRLLTLVAFVAIAKVLWSVGGDYVGPGSEAMAFGFLLLSSHLAGEVGGLMELPRITGFMVLGILIGPQILGIISRDAVVDLRLINGGALSLIALTAGGELRLESVRRRFRSILSILTVQVVVIIGAVVAAVYWGRGLVPFLADAPPRVAVAVGLIFGLVAVAKSPATTVAVITEERAKGIFTETVLGITVMKDVVVLILIAIMLPLAEVIAHPTSHFSFRALDEVLLSVLASLVVGLGLGWLLVQYLRRASEYRVIVLLFTAFFLVSVSERLHLEYILIAMAAGFYVQNFSRQGPAFLRGLEANSLAIYAVFFGVAGADLRIDVLGEVWVIAALMIVIRLMALIGSTYLGGWLAGDPPAVKRYAWMGFVAQAGVTLGIANMVRDRFDAWGPSVATIIVAMIAVNQLIGPPAFRFALIRAGESRRAERARRNPRPAPAPATA